MARAPSYFSSVTQAPPGVTDTPSFLPRRVTEESCLPQKPVIEAGITRVVGRYCKFFGFDWL